MTKLGWLAGFYRELAPMDPRIVDRLYPTDVAAMLGLDLEELVQVVAFENRPFVNLGDPNSARKPRLREVTT